MDYNDKMRTVRNIVNNYKRESKKDKKSTYKIRFESEEGNIYESGLDNLPSFSYIKENLNTNSDKIRFSIFKNEVQIRDPELIESDYKESKEESKLLTVLSNLSERLDRIENLKNNNSGSDVNLVLLELLKSNKEKDNTPILIELIKSQNQTKSDPAILELSKSIQNTQRELLEELRELRKGGGDQNLKLFIRPLLENWDREQTQKFWMGLLNNPGVSSILKSVGDKFNGGSAGVTLQGDQKKIDYSEFENE